MDKCSQWLSAESVGNAGGLEEYGVVCYSDENIIYKLTTADMTADSFYLRFDGILSGTKPLKAWAVNRIQITREFLSTIFAQNFFCLGVAMYKLRITLTPDSQGLGPLNISLTQQSQQLAYFDTGTSLPGTILFNSSHSSYDATLLASQECTDFILRGSEGKWTSGQVRASSKGSNTEQFLANTDSCGRK